MLNQQSEPCCEMRKKVILGIAKVLSEEECGVPDSVLADYSEFSYKSRTEFPVAVALNTQYCAWCGARRDPNGSRHITEVIRPHQ